MAAKTESASRREEWIRTVDEKGIVKAREELCVPSRDKRPQAKAKQRGKANLSVARCTQKKARSGAKRKERMKNYEGDVKALRAQLEKHNK